MNSFRVKVGNEWLRFYAGSKIKMLMKMPFFQTPDEPFTRTFTSRIPANLNQHIFKFSNITDTIAKTFECECEVFLKTSYMGKAILIAEAYGNDEYNIRVTIGRGAYLPILKKKLRDFKYINRSPYRTNQDAVTGLPIYPYVDWGFSFSAGQPLSGPEVNTKISMFSTHLQQQIEIMVPYNPPSTLVQHIDAIASAINANTNEHCIFVYRVGLNMLRSYDLASNDNGPDIAFEPENLDWYNYFNDVNYLSFSHPGPGNAELQHYLNVVSNPGKFDYVFFPVLAPNSSRDGYDFGAILNHWYPIAPYGPAPQNINYPGGFTGYTHAALTPFAFLKRTLQYIHQEANVTVNDLFFDEELSQLVFFNPVIMSLINQTGVGIINRTFKYANLLPDITYGELMDALRVMFGLIPDFNSRKEELTLATRKSVLLNQEVEDWTAYIVKEYSVRRLPEVLSFDYEFPSDETENNRIANLVSRNIKDAVQQLNDLPAQAANMDVRLVESTNQYYSYYKQFLTGSWQALGEGLNPYIPLNTNKNLNTKISTLFNSVQSSKYQPLGYSINWAIPYTGQLIENYSTQKKSVTPQLLFYRDFIAAANVQTGPASFTPVLVPSGSYHNYDFFGNKIGNYSLAWHGSCGLIESFHKEWLSLMANSSPVKFKATLTENEILDPKPLIKKQIGNQRYILDEIEVTFTDDGFEVPTITAWPLKQSYE